MRTLFFLSNIDQPPLLSTPPAMASFRREPESALSSYPLLLSSSLLFSLAPSLFLRAAATGNSSSQHEEKQQQQQQLPPDSNSSSSDTDQRKSHRRPAAIRRPSHFSTRTNNVFRQVSRGFEYMNDGSLTDPSIKQV
ncbi:hypothetical protein KY285_022746 [Solanum tuberosum]|nr:hypothetical protein KY285_022746 [Solanum tuberosum]